MKRLLNNRGENEAGQENKGAGSGEGDKVFKQEDVDRIINKRFADYKTLQEQNAELIKFKTEHEKQQDLVKQKQLEEQGKYEEAKKTYESKIGEYQGILSKKDQAINDLKVSYSLQSEISKVNAVPEVADLMKNLAVVQEDGSIKIRGKDANGIDTLLPLDQGVKQFLKEKPYLIKAGKQGGSGTSSGMGQEGTNSSGGEDDLTSLNQQLQAAMTSGDHKTATEIVTKIKKQQASRGISSFV